jgi:hypothetical protein
VIAGRRAGVRDDEQAESLFLVGRIRRRTDRDAVNVARAELADVVARADEAQRVDRVQRPSIDGHDVEEPVGRPARQPAQLLAQMQQWNALTGARSIRNDELARTRIQHDQGSVGESRCTSHLAETERER